MVSINVVITYKNAPDTDEDLFNILHGSVKQWFWCKYKKFHLPQSYALMEIQNRRNVLVSSPTGTGKTLTAFLTIINSLIDLSDKGDLKDHVYCVYVSPLKALNYDIEQNLSTPLKEIEQVAGKKFGLRVAVRTGDTTLSERRKMLKNPPHILITTPESLSILLSSPNFAKSLKNLDWCIIDEIHALCENKRGVALSLALERLEYHCTYLTRVGLSATINPLEDVARYLAGDRNCQIVNVPSNKNLNLKTIAPKNLVSYTYDIVKDLHKLIQAHATTLIFTNTRAATERIVMMLRDEYPKFYNDNIGAHHSSVGVENRRNIEQKLRAGKLKAVVCSTSLELGIDIGYIDLVVCVGSPKSVSRFLQRAGRAGHKINATVKARLFPLSRDDYVECKVIECNALSGRLEPLNIPKNPLDVLAQEIYALSLQERLSVNDLYALVTKSYCYSTLDRQSYMSVLDYLEGRFDIKNVYAKIRVEDGHVTRRGRLARMIYLTNLGTIPDQSTVRVKIMGTNRVVGSLDEPFLEKLNPGDVFVLAGNLYQYAYTREMSVYVRPAYARKPTVPRWSSDALSVSYELGQDIGRYRLKMHDMLNAGEKAPDYFTEQYNFSKIPHVNRLVIENVTSERKFVVFHATLGKKANRCLCLALSYVISKQQGRDVEKGYSDTGFYVSFNGAVNALKAFKALKPSEFEGIVQAGVMNTQLLRRRFRHCAVRSLMILRNYKGNTKGVGMQQFSSKFMLSTVKKYPNFPILKEALSETFSDLDVKGALKFLSRVENGDLRVEQTFSTVPSPFSLELLSQSLDFTDRHTFINSMHSYILAKISLKK